MSISPHAAAVIDLLRIAHTAITALQQRDVSLDRGLALMRRAEAEGREPSLEEIDALLHDLQDAIDDARGLGDGP